MLLRTEDVVRELGAEVFGDPPPIIERVSTDTRTIDSGSCFVALQGPNFDAHDFLNIAQENGANLLVVSKTPRNSPLPCLLVRDTLFALGEMARLWRNANRRIQVASVVGSSGKTTTKEMTGAVLGETEETLITRGNLNNLIGVPQMIFDLQVTHRKAVLELGMNQPGELHRLMQIASPDCLVMTNITNAHIGMFGSRHELYMAKTDSIRAARPDATLVLNCDDELSRKARDEYAGERKVMGYGFSDDADVRAENIRSLEPYGYSFKISIAGEKHEVRINAFGRHNISNALAAAAVGQVFGVPGAEIAARLSAFLPKANRSEVEQVQGCYIIKDYYNASPAAVEAALTSLKDFNVPGKRFAVLADMLELGNMEEEYHRNVGRLAAHCGLSAIVTLGDRGRWINDAACDAGIRAEHASDAASAANTLKSMLRPGDLLLIKGSRLMKLEQVYNLLKG